MADASFLQTSFLGGEWSPFSQGRMDRPDYRQALNVGLNVTPLEEGGITRRPGFRYLAPTRRGAAAILREFHFNENQPYNLEFTPGHLRTFDQNGLVKVDGGSQVTFLWPVSPALLDTGGAHGFTTGDDVEFRLTVPGPAPEAGRLLNRQFTVTVVDTVSFTIVDAITGLAFDGSTATIPVSGLSVAKVLDKTTQYTTAAMLADIRLIQDAKTLAVLHPTVAPWQLVLTADPTPCTPATFDWNAIVFQDGPYLDPVITGETITPSALTGAITVTASGATFGGFVSTDVGRMMRLLSEPATWAAATAYTVGNNVTYAGLYYTRLVAGTTSTTPDVDTTNWAIAVTASQWAWGVITAVASSTSATLTLHSGQALLYTVPVTTWRLGLYSNTTGWPTTGVYHEGRFWIANNFIPNRLDASMSNKPYIFSPTGTDGTVADNNGISAIFQSKEVNPIRWLVVDDNGIMAGTQGGEWLIRSSAMGDPITPTSIQAREVTRYGSEKMEVHRIGETTIFVQRFNRKLIEYTSLSTSKYTGKNLTLNSKHITAPGIAEVAYQREIVPKLWLRLLDGTLAGVTYKHERNDTGYQIEAFAAWHRNALGHGRFLESIQSGPTHYGLDAPSVITRNLSTNVRWVERLTDLFGQNAIPLTAFFLDGGRVPPASEIISLGGGAEAVRYYGFDDLEGTTLSVWAAGLDLGDFVVTSGVVDVPLASVANPTFTRALLASITPTFLPNGADIYRLGVYTRGAAASGTPAAPNVNGVLWLSHANTDVSGVKNFIHADWDNNRAFVYVTGHGAGTGIRRFNLTTGVEDVEADTATLYGVDDASHNIGYGALDKDGNSYFTTDGSNSCVVAKVTPDLATLTTWGTSSASFGSTASHLAASRMMQGVDVGGGNWVVSSALNGNILGSGEIALFDGDYMVFNYALTTFEYRTLLSNYRRTIGDCTDFTTLYVMGTAMESADPNTTALSLYKLVLTRLSGAREAGTQAALGNEFARLQFYNPADIDPTWTTFAGGGAVAGVVIDETDGNVIFDVASAAGPTHTHYLVKVNGQTGQIMWKIADTGINPGGNRVRNGSLAYLSSGGSSPYQLYKVNTIAGTVDVATHVVNVVSTGHAYDGQTGTLLGFGNYTSGGGAPVQVGTTPTSFTSEWFTFGAGTSGGYAAVDYYAPAVIGWTYNTDIQILRPIAPQESGAQNGPALAKTRRAHQFGALLHRTGPIKIGTTFTDLRPVEFKTPGGTAYATGQLYNGIAWGTIEDDYSFDSMIALRVTRPNPATVLTIGSFLHTQDR